MLEVPVERGRVPLLVDDVEVDVRRVAAAELGDDHRRPDEARPLALRSAAVVDEDEDVLPPLRVLDLLREAPLRLLEDATHSLAIVREIDGVQVVRDLEQGLLVRRDRAADFVVEHARGGGLPRSPARRRAARDLRRDAGTARGQRTVLPRGDCREAGITRAAARSSTPRADAVHERRWNGSWRHALPCFSTRTTSHGPSSGASPSA